jgi:hypothetical protein
MVRFQNFLRETWRVRWMLAFALAIVAVRAYGLLPEESVTLRTLYRPAIGSMGFVVAHVGWSQVFPYLDMRDLLRRSQIDEDRRNGDPFSRWASAVAFGAVCVARGLVYSAFVVGAMLAL